MKLKKQNLVGGFNRYRLVITLGLAVLLPAAALIYVNFNQLRTFERDKVLEATIRRDFQEVLAIDEGKMRKKTYGKVDEARELFPSPDDDPQIKEEKLKNVLAQCSCFEHAFLYDEQGLILQTQPGEETDKYVRDEHEYLADSYKTWFGSKEGKQEVEILNRRPHKMAFGGAQTKRSDG